MTAEKRFYIQERIKSLFSQWSVIIQLYSDLLCCHLRLHWDFFFSNYYISKYSLSNEYNTALIAISQLMNSFTLRDKWAFLWL